MYIDEIKKLLKDIEKSIQGDRKWIEKGDYKIKEKMDLVLENTTPKEVQYSSIPFIMPDDFMLSQYQRKNNIVPQISNFIDKKNVITETIKLPSNIITPRRVTDKRTIVFPLLIEPFDQQLSVEVILDPKTNLRSDNVVSFFPDHSIVPINDPKTIFLTVFH